MDPPPLPTRVAQANAHQSNDDGNADSAPVLLLPVGVSWGWRLSRGPPEPELRFRDMLTYLTHLTACPSSSLWLESTLDVRIPQRPYGHAHSPGIIRAELQQSSSSALPRMRASVRVGVGLGM